MIIEREIESQIIQALRSPGLDAVMFSGAWTSAESGSVKGEEDESAVAVMSVTVSPRFMETYAGGYGDVVADIPVNVSFAVSAESDPTGALMIAAYESASARIWHWVKTVDAQTESDLAVVGDDGSAMFSPGGVMSGGGTPPVYSSAARMWSWSIQFNIKGIIH